MSFTRFSYWLRGDRPELGPDQRERLALETARNRIFITGAMFIKKSNVLSHQRGEQACLQTHYDAFT